MRNFIDRRIVAEYCRRFNALDSELYRGDIPNAEAEEFLTEQIPRFDCPDPVFREIWYFRWWSFRKHIRTTPRRPPREPAKPMISSTPARPHPPKTVSGMRATLRTPTGVLKNSVERR